MSRQLLDYCLALMVLRALVLAAAGALARRLRRETFAAWPGRLLLRLVLILAAEAATLRSGAHPVGSLRTVSYTGRPLVPDPSDANPRQGMSWRFAAAISVHDATRGRWS